MNLIQSKLLRVHRIALGLGVSGIVQPSIGFQQHRHASHHLVSFYGRNTLTTPITSINSIGFTKATTTKMSFSATTAKGDVLEKNDLIDEISRQLSFLGQENSNSNNVTMILNTKDDEDGMVEVFSQSFLDDSLMEWIANVPSSLSPSDRTNAVLDLNRWLMRGMNCGILNGERGVAFGIKDNGSMAGVMTIIPSSCSREPDMEKDFMFAESPTSKEETKGNYGSKHPQRLESLGLLDEKCDKIMNAAPYGTNKFIYLKAVGVLKEHQGKGYGKRLLMVLLNAADCLKVPIYLETQNEGNVGLYKHFGFDMVETITLGVGDEEFLGYLMVRPPK